MLPGQRTSAGPFDWDHSGKACKGGAVEWKVKGHCFAALRHYLSPRYQAMLIQKAAGVRDRLLMGSSWKGPIAAWRSCSWDKSWGAILMNCSSQGRLLLGESIGQLLLVNMTASCMLYVLFCSWLSCFRHFARRFWIVESKNEREFVYDTRIIPGTIPKMREKRKEIVNLSCIQFPNQRKPSERKSEREREFVYDTGIVFDHLIYQRALFAECIKQHACRMCGQWESVFCNNRCQVNCHETVPAGKCSQSH